MPGASHKTLARMTRAKDTKARRRKGKRQEMTTIALGEDSACVDETCDVVPMVDIEDSDPRR